MVYFFINPIAKYALELTATRAIGSEVNIDSIQVDYSKPSVKLKRLQITDYDKPVRNLIEIDNISMDLSWEELLRMSLTSENMNIENIRIHTKRERPGKIASKKNKLLDFSSDTADKALENVKKEANNDLLSQALNIAQGEQSGKKALKALEDQLKTKKISEDLENQIKNLKKDWSLFLKEDIEGKKTKSLIKEIETFDIKSDDIQKSLKDSKNLLSKTKSHYKILRKKIKDFKTQSENLKSDIVKSPESFIKDFKYIKNTVSSDSLNPKNITTAMLSSYVAIQFNNFSRIREGIKNQVFKDVTSLSPIDIGQSKIDEFKTEHLNTKDTAGTNPAKDSEPENDELSLKQIELNKRDLSLKKGTWVHFNAAKPRPKLWIKNIKLNSVSQKQQDLGDFKGLVKNYTSEPHIIQKPLTIDLIGSLPKIEATGLKIKTVMDYTNPLKPKEDFSFNLNSFKVKGLKLVESSKYNIAISKAIGKLNLKASFVEDSINLSFDQKFISPIWEMIPGNTESNKLKTLLNEIKKAENDLSIRANISGSIENPKINLSSNFGTIVKKALESQIRGKVNNEMAKVQKKIQQKLQEKLKGKISDLDLLESSFSKENNSLESISSSLEKKIKSKAKQKGKEKIDKLKNKLLKKIKF